MEIATVSQAKTLESYDDVSDDEGLYNDAGVRDKGFTRRDQRDMQRMGKRQEMLRNFRPLSALSFTVLIQATWEWLLIANTQGLVDGGLAGLWWSYVWTFVGFGIVTMCLAEMSSMAPTSGGQYHWVSEFAPPLLQKTLSYITGWFAVLSWQSGTAADAFLCGTFIQALITINNPSYEAQNWHATLLTFAVVVLLCISNIQGARIFPLLQNVFLVVHCFGFLAVIIVLWVMSPRNPPRKVFLQFTNDGGWPTMGLSLMVGQISAMFGFLGSDATVHMSEETSDAGYTVPTAMCWAYILNAVLGAILLITYLFCVTDVAAALADPSEYPFIWVFKQALSTGGVNTMLMILFILLLASSIAFNASTSRQTFAFARDKGLPFEKWLSNVHTHYHVPVNSILTTGLISALLACINLFSTTAFNAMLSLNVSALMFTYAISISCVLYRRIYHPDLLPKVRWSLGRWGVPLNVLGVSYSTFAFFWSLWPNVAAVDAETMTYAPAVFVAVLITAMVIYFFQGRHVYLGPVAKVQPRNRSSRGHAMRQPRRYQQPTAE